MIYNNNINNNNNNNNNNNSYTFVLHLKMQSKLRGAFIAVRCT